MKSYFTSHKVDYTNDDTINLRCESLSPIFTQVTHDDIMTIYIHTYICSELKYYVDSGPYPTKLCILYCYVYLTSLFKDYPSAINTRL